jgi:hypothetical protein
MKDNQMRPVCFDVCVYICILMTRGETLFFWRSARLVLFQIFIILNNYNYFTYAFNHNKLIFDCFSIFFNIELFYTLKEINEY